MVFVTQCPEMILLRQFTPVCLLPVKIKILLDDSKINLIENTEFYGTSPTVTCPSAQLCQLLSICMKPSPSALFSGLPVTPYWSRIKPANLPRLDNWFTRE